MKKLNKTNILKIRKQLKRFSWEQYKKLVRLNWKSFKKITSEPLRIIYIGLSESWYAVYKINIYKEWKWIAGCSVWFYKTKEWIKINNIQPLLYTKAVEFIINYSLNEMLEKKLLIK